MANIYAIIAGGLIRAAARQVTKRGSKEALKRGSKAAMRAAIKARQAAAIAARRARREIGNLSDKDIETLGRFGGWGVSLAGGYALDKYRDKVTGREVVNVMASSAIDKMAWTESTLELEVTFKGGQTYTYAGVSQETWLAFQAAPSKGTFFAQHIRNNYSVR